MISRQTYLPAAVKLMDPAGTQETVYQFKFNTGKFGGILQKLLGRNNDPFQPDLTGYRKLDASVNVQHAGGATPPGALPGAMPPGGNPSEANPTVRKTVFLPSLIGMPWKDADKIIKSAGLEPKFAKGPAAPKPEQVYQVYQQEPPPKTAVEPGTEVRVVLFTEVAPAN